MLTSVEDANHHKTLYDYDVLSRLTKTTDALGVPTRMYYDANGNLTEVVADNGATTFYAYDTRNRRTQQFPNLILKRATMRCSMLPQARVQDRCGTC